MTKRNITETIYEYDENEKLRRKVVTTTEEEDEYDYWSNLFQYGNDESDCDCDCGCSCSSCDSGYVCGKKLKTMLM